MNMRKILIFSIICIMLLAPLVSLATICAPCNSLTGCGSNEKCVPIDGNSNNDFTNGGECQHESGPAVICVNSPLKYTKIEDIIENVLNYVFYGALIIAPLMIIIGAILFMTSGGNPGMVDKAKKIIFWSIIGFLIITASRGIISLIRYIIGA